MMKQNLKIEPNAVLVVDVILTNRIVKEGTKVQWDRASKFCFDGTSTFDANEKEVALIH